MIRAAVVAVVAVGLPGCVALWGGGYHIESENSQSITMKYDSHFASLSEVQNVAEAECRHYGKRAISQNSTSAWGITTVVFDCVAKPQ
jgi:hypothetical protein